MNEVVACLATIPSRKKELKLVCESLLPQVDRLFIYFNEYTAEEVPLWAKIMSKVFWVCSDDSGHGDLGDVGKFYFSSKEMRERYDISGYVLTCDDDIVYPDWHASNTIAYLERSAGKRVIFSYHGAKLPRKCINYHRQKRQFAVKETVSRLTQVHVAGTGCMAFDSNQLFPSLKMFKHINMADIYVAKWAKENSVPLYVLPHKKGDFGIMDVQSTIWHSTHHRDGSAKDRSGEINAIVSKLRWDPLSRPQL